MEVSRRFPVWLRPKSQYGTPMCNALDIASQAIEDWIVQYPESYPPTVINVSDGMATDGDPTIFAERIMNLRTNDGEVLIFNCHLSKVNAKPCEYPDRIDEVPQYDEYAPLMYRMSSLLPDSSRDRALSLDLPVSENSRGYVFNADMKALVQFLDIGTRASNLH